MVAVLNKIIFSTAASSRLSSPEVHHRRCGEKFALEFEFATVECWQINIYKNENTVVRMIIKIF